MAVPALLGRVHAEDAIHAVARIADALSLGRSLRVLVLFDPDAIICQGLRDLGYAVDCCPDLQRGWSEVANHERVVAQEADDLFHALGQWEVVIGAIGWDRYLAVHSPSRVQQFLDWVRERSTVAIFSCPRQPIAPDLNRQGPYRARELFGKFAYVGEVSVADLTDAEHRDPLLAVSDHHLVSRSFHVPGAALCAIGRADARDSARVRTFLAGADRIVKVEAVSEDYFERSQVSGEARFLDGIDAQTRRALSLPRTLAVDRGAAVVSLVREAIPGVAFEDVPGLQRAHVMAEVLREAARFAAQGLFHNDLRPWNVVWNGETCRFVDFADTSTWDDDVHGLSQVGALVGTMVLIGGTSLEDRDAFPARVRAWAVRCDVHVDMPNPEAWLSLPELVDVVEIHASGTDEVRFEHLARQLLPGARDGVHYP